MESVWLSRDLVVLEALGNRLESSPGVPVRPLQVCTDTSMERAAVLAALAALGESHIVLEYQHSDPLVPRSVVALTNEGRRAAGLWPPLPPTQEPVTSQATITPKAQELGSERIDYGRAGTWQPSTGFVSMAALLGGVFGYSYAYVATRSYFREFGVPIEDFDLGYSNLLIRATMSFGVILAVFAVAAAGAGLFDRYLHRYVLRKIPSGRIDGGPIVFGVSQFALLGPLGLIVGILTGFVVGTVALRVIPSAEMSRVPVVAQVALFGLIVLVMSALSMYLLAIFTAWGVVKDIRKMQSGGVSTQSGAASPQFRLIVAIVGITLIMGVLWYGGEMQGRSAARDVKRSTAPSLINRWFDESLVPGSACVRVTWTGAAPPEAFKKGETFLYLGRGNDQTLLYSPKWGTLWVSISDVVLTHPTHVNCRLKVTSAA